MDLQDRVFIDIGCNKGYVSASFFALWAPELRFSPAGIARWNPHGDCGSCGDCMDEVAPARRSPPEAKGARVRVVCVEPNLTTFGSLIAMREHFFPANRSRPTAEWFLVNAAISNRSARTTAFPRCPPSNEQCGFDPEPGALAHGVDVVPLYSVDELLDMFNFSSVDVLKMDTEGFDAPAVNSAVHSLQSGRISILSFEYHSKGAWQHHKLEDIVDVLDGLDFVCYFSGRRGSEGWLARMTGCWSSAYEHHWWSNVVCVRRSHELYPHAERASLRYTNATYRGLYFREAALPGSPADKPAAAARRLVQS